MHCNRCPHHVKHGRYCQEKEQIVFKNLCGLKLKNSQEDSSAPKKGRSKGRPPPTETLLKEPIEWDTLDCIHIPFQQGFDYIKCEVYQRVFSSSGLRNGVLPTKDFQYSEKLAGTSVTDMEYL